MARIFITGGTGFIGAALSRALVGRGDAVTVASRNPKRARESVPEVEAVAVDEDWSIELASCDAVVNLAGESVGGKRWSAEFKRRLRSSRLDITNKLVDTIGTLPAADRPSVLVSASGTDYYPIEKRMGGTTYDESAPAGDSFLADLCREWEVAAFGAEGHGVRVVTMRTGLVLGDGGALSKMAGPFKFFVGGRIGSGDQPTSWIHLADAVGGYRAAIDNEAIRGPVNLVAPEVIDNRTFTTELGRALGRPSLVPAPAFAIKLAVGEFATYILGGRTVVPAALTAAGYEFEFTGLTAALAEIYR